MTKQIHEPGPGRSTSQAAFDDLREEIAQRNERAHREARNAQNSRGDVEREAPEVLPAFHCGRLRTSGLTSRSFCCGTNQQ